MKSFVRNILHSLGWEMYRYPQACERMEPHLKMIFARQPIDLLLDVGANEGQFATEARSLGYRGPIVSFEPIPEMVQLLKSKASADGKWSVVPTALGRANETKQFHITKSSDFSSLRAPNAECKSVFVDGGTVERVIDVTVKRLADVLPECLSLSGSSGRSILLKMDTQGSDNEVLDGAEPILDRVCGVISEVVVRPLYDGSTRYLEQIARLERWGFELTGLFPVSRDPQLRVIEFNCVMFKSK